MLQRPVKRRFVYFQGVVGDDLVCLVVDCQYPHPSPPTAEHLEEEA